MYEIGKRIRMFREKQGFSQKDLATTIGAKSTTVSNWEKGLSRPDVDMLAKICAAMQVSADELLDITIAPDNLTAQERQLILLYREKLELRHAVNVLLGIPDAGDSLEQD